MSIIVKGFPHKLSNFFKEQIRKQEMKEEDVSPKRKWCISGFLFLQSKIICVCVLVNGWHLSSISKSYDSYPPNKSTSKGLTDCFQQLHNFFVLQTYLFPTFLCVFLDAQTEKDFSSMMIGGVSFLCSGHRTPFNFLEGFTCFFLVYEIITKDGVAILQMMI